MIIRHAEWSPYVDPARRIATRGESAREPRRGLVLRLENDDGDLAWGEATPFPAITGDGLDDVETSLERWAATWLPVRLPSEAVSDPTALLETLDAWNLRSMAARSAIETALLDMLSRRQKLAAHQWLRTPDDAAGPVELQLSGLLFPDEPAAMERQAKDLLDRGFTSLKVKMGLADRFESDRMRLEAVRRILGADRGLRIDVNGQWQLIEARALLARLAAYDPEFVEEPVAGKNLLEVGDSPVAIAADESLLDDDLRKKIFQAGTCSVAVLKPTWLGGPLAAWRIARKARALGIEPAFSHAFEGPIATAAAMEVALSMAPLRWPCGLWSFETWPAWKIAPLPQISHGRIVSADRPGLGVPHFEPPK